MMRVVLVSAAVPMAAIRGVREANGAPPLSASACKRRAVLPVRPSSSARVFAMRRHRSAVHRRLEQSRPRAQRGRAEEVGGGGSRQPAGRLGASGRRAADWYSHSRRHHRRCCHRSVGLLEAAEEVVAQRRAAERAGASACRCRRGPWCRPRRQRLGQAPGRPRVGRSSSPSAQSPQARVHLGVL